MPLLFPKLLHRKRKREGPTLHGKPCTMAELRHYVIFDRDRACVAWMLGSGHECRDSFGTPHSPTELHLLQFAHVPEQGMNALGKRAPDDELHGVAECAAANAFPGPTAEQRAFERRWISQHEPSA